MSIRAVEPYQPQYPLIRRKRFDMNSTLDGVPESFLIDGVLHRSVTLIYGQAFAGKSTIAASIAVALATGKTEWAGRAVSPSGHGPVLIACGDPDSYYEYDERLSKVKDEFTALGQYVELVEPQGPMSPAAWEEIRTMARGAGAKTVIIDNLSQFNPGSLNDDDAVKQFYDQVNLFARRGIAVLVLAHVSDKKGPDGKAARLPIGSSLIRFGPRWEALVWRGGGRLHLEFNGNNGSGRWWLDLTEPDGTPRFDVLGSKTTGELKEGRERFASGQRGRHEKTEDDRSAVGDWVIANCQDKNGKQAAEAVAGEFPAYKVETARNFLSKGAFGGVENVGTRTAPRWERPPAPV